MWGNDGKGSPPPFSSEMPRELGWRAPGDVPQRADSAEEVGRADVRADLPDIEDLVGMDGASDTRMQFPGGAAEVDSPAFRRARARQYLREILRSIPRADTTESFTFQRPDGLMRTVTRAEISAVVDGMRPRMRRIIRLAVEERWPRKRVCEHLGISIKTYERDHVEALDMLVDM
ncbi:MAG TPA: hypothetical protein VKQ30_16850 [Ktedonobacterales bacterium]|nr:hypothetical protein [Ktedonobacterales bacterium]